MQNNVSRRNFFKGAGVAALGALAAGSLSGCGHGYAAATPNNPSTGDFGGPSWLGAPPEILESDITETLDTEVLVVGIGTGGIPAMISAAENGAKVLGIDRQGTPKNVREDIGAIDSRLQKASFDEFPEFKIDKKEAIEDIVRYANGFVNYDVVKLWANESGAMVDWLTDIIERDGKLVMEFEGGVGDTSDPGRDKAYATGHSPQLTDAVAEDEEWGFAESILAYAAEQGAEVRWFTEFIKCEQDENGRVTGVIARDVKNDRHYIRINASKGVILSTGGYGNNLEMMEDRQAWNQKIRIAAPGSGGNPTGDGIKACLWMGATMDPLGAAVTFNRACVKPDQTAGDGVLGRWFWFGEQPFLKLNLKGERFCNESGPYDYMLHSTIMQPQQTYVDIWDANHAAQAEAMDEVGCCRLFPFPNGAKNNIPMQVVDGMIDKLIEDGYVQKADTMEELAEKLNLPVETTVASWKHYNEMAKAGEDTDYFKEKHRLMAIDTPPYYGVRTGAWFLATIDGITIDTNMHPCDENGDPIQGIYLTGNDSGGFFSVSYPNLMTGLACGRTMTFGRRAGMLAATGQA
ncbi:FAD-binding protein [Adlercreutzia equolifaciens]|uniref:FAD-dependent oxidoreductase n=1 Tax=Adlercreutzia equolifaciens TaxID=446660 RepID=UPI0023B17DF1|nr:FAD-binding protein [Adlercreutzia equolifaciens]MDE8702764.1 FAD-binding protein [Adlercreutzia equolifaciens]